MVMYGVSVKVNPFPNSRMAPYIEIGGGAYQASADDLTVTEDGQVIIPNSMDDASGPVITGAFGMQYGINERWTAYSEFNNYHGLGESFAPGNLLLRDPDDPEVEGSSIQIGSIVLGIAIGF